MTKPAVPYCTVKGFQKCLQLLRADPPSRVDRQALVNRGLSPHAAYPVLGALRYLGVIAEDGTLTNRLKAFHDDDIEARHAIVSEAYGDILADVSFPVDEREEVDRILIDRHDCAPGVAAFCSTLFLWLAAEAGMPVAVLGRQRRGRPPAHLSQLSAPALAILENRGRALRPEAQGRPELSAQLDEIFGGAERGSQAGPSRGKDAPSSSSQL